MMGSDRKEGRIPCLRHKIGIECLISFNIDFCVPKVSAQQWWLSIRLLAYHRIRLSAESMLCIRV